MQWHGWTESHTEWSKRESKRERQISYDITYLWNLKQWYKETYLQNRNRLTDIENKLMVTKGQRGGDKVQINRYTLLYIKQMNNKDLLYSTGNYIQYLVINYKRIWKSIYVYVCVYIYVNHFAVHLKLTRHCKSTILQLKKKESWI